MAKISGDGNLSKWQIMYYNTCSTLLEEFKDDIHIVFGNKKMSEGTMSSGTRYIAVYGRDVVAKLLNYLSSYNSFNILIPDVVLNSKETVIREYIRAFYDDEGCSSLRLNRKTNEWKRKRKLH